MLEQKAQQNLQVLLDRFYLFDDAVLRSITLRYSSNKNSLELVLECRDSQASENNGWCSVRLILQQVEEFRIREACNTTIQVLSSGLQIRAVEGKIVLEFSGYAPPIHSITDARTSDAYAVGCDIKYEVAPYQSL